MRLVGGRSIFDGRVEICSAGRWAAVCDRDSWDLREAVVVCDKLGFSVGGV